MADAAELREQAPRPFAILHEDPDTDTEHVMGYGMRLADGTAVFVWTGTEGGFGLFSTVDQWSP